MKQILFFVILLMQFPFSPLNSQTVTADYLMGKFDPSKHSDFILIDKKYTLKPDLYLRKETYEAFKKMAVAAEKEGVIFSILSATRNFDYQKNIWESKWAALKDKTAEVRAKKILQYSAMPGASRHHWGTDIDLNNLSNPFFEKNGGKKIYDWLVAHGHEYGFYQPYTAGRKTGYKEEKWHWTYLPLSKDFTAIASKYLKNDMIKGFKGSDAAAKLDILKNYVLGINKDCL